MSNANGANGGDLSVNNNQPDLSNNPNPAPQDPAIPPTEVVSKEAYEQVKSDLFKMKDTVKTLSQTLEQQKLDGLKQKQDWEGIAKLKEQEADDFKSRYEGLKNSLVENAKNSSLRDAARKAGILEQSLGDLEMLDFPELHVETTSTGKILVSGADQAIESLKRKRPHWFGSKPASVNPASPEVRPPANGLVTLEDIKRLEAEYKKAPQSEIAKKTYFDAIMAYKNQNP